MYQDKFIINIDDQDYAIGYPNVGQQMEIESMKLLLSANKYAQIGTANSRTGNQLLDLIDAVSYFSVMVPSLKPKLELKDFAQIDVLFQKKLTKAFYKYNNEFILKVEESIAKLLEDARPANQ